MTPSNYHSRRQLCVPALAVSRLTNRDDVLRCQSQVTQVDAVQGVLPIMPICFESALHNCPHLIESQSRDLYHYKLHFSIRNYVLFNMFVIFSIIRITRLAFTSDNSEHIQKTKIEKATLLYLINVKRKYSFKPCFTKISNINSSY